MDKGKGVIEKESATLDETAATTGNGGGTFDFMTSVGIEETNESTDSPKDMKKDRERTIKTSNLAKRKSPSPVSFFEQNLVRQQNYFNS